MSGCQRIKQADTLDRPWLFPSNKPWAPWSALRLYLGGTAFAVLGLMSAALAVSYVYCPAHIVPAIKPLCDDQHYKYLVPLLIPVTVWFTIANWVGWEYFRYA